MGMHRHALTRLTFEWFDSDTIHGGQPSCGLARGGFVGRKLSGSVSMAVLWLATASAPVLAQVNTGTVLGTVKDAQGGVIPGATVTLISEARGTRSAPVVTNESGDFVFANVTADTYTVEVTLESFKTSQRVGHRGQPGHPRRRRAR